MSSVKTVGDATGRQARARELIAGLRARIDAVTLTTAGLQPVPSMVTGALLMVLSDFVAQRLLAPAQLPVGVVTGAVGGGYLAWLLTVQWRKGIT